MSLLCSRLNSYDGVGKHLKYMFGRRVRMKLRCFSILAKPGCFPPQFHPLPLRAVERMNELAISDELGTHTHGDILLRAVKLSQQMTSKIGDRSMKQVAILMPNDHRYIVCQWAAWISKLCAVPLHHSLTGQLLDYHLKDSQSEILLVSDDLQNNISQLNIHPDNLIVVPKHAEEGSQKDLKMLSQQKEITHQWRNQPAHIVYTSGTTGPPKGVVATHSQLHAQSAAVASEWFLNINDTVLHHLPLHHTHGIVNGLVAPLQAGSKIHMLPKFSPQKVWEELLSEENTVNVLMGVPTMYAMLISFAEERFLKKLNLVKDFLQIKLRLCTCGSASLPDSVLKKWQSVSGHMLLERYGMSEFGMGLGNPLKEEERKVGFVGRPFPGIRVRISKRDGYSKNKFKTIFEGDKYSVKRLEDSDDGIGELLVKGPQLFTSYYNKPEETKKAFTQDGWFITGDIAAYDGDAFKILGRSSVDIIKCGGYKISALDVERTLLQHPSVSEAAVIGLPDALFGQKIVAVLVVSEPKVVKDIQKFCAKMLPKYSLPSQIIVVDKIARNALGKVNKVDLRKELFPNVTKEYSPV